MKTLNLFLIFFFLFLFNSYSLPEDIQCLKGKEEGDIVYYNFVELQAEYRGEFKEIGPSGASWCHGQGTLTITGGVWEKGMKYVGEWKKGYLDGEVKIYRKGQVWFEGEYKRGKKHGKGISYINQPKWLKFEGEYKNGVKHGPGTLYLTDGSVIKGEWINGISRGKAVMIKKDGSIIKGEYNSGIFR